MGPKRKRLSADAAIANILAFLDDENNFDDDGSDLDELYGRCVLLRVIIEFGLQWMQNEKAPKIYDILFLWL